MPEPGIGEIGEIYEVGESIKVEIGFFAIMRVFCEKSGFGLAIFIQSCIVVRRWRVDCFVALAMTRGSGFLLTQE